jgi:hypothetical protein
VLTRVLLIEASRRVGAVVFGGVLLWQVAENVCQGDGEVVVHVAEAGAVVSIDGRDCPFDLAPGEPICRTLRPGRHTLAMRREDRVVYEESFTLDPGGHAVLTARDETRKPSTPTARPAPAR